MRKIRTGLIVVLVFSACVVMTMCKGSPQGGGPSSESVGETKVGTHFKGRLVDTNQRAVSGARLYIFAALGGKGAAQEGQAPLSREMTATDVNGGFEFKGINPGTYSLQFYWQRQSGEGHLYLDAQEFWLTVDPNETTADVSVVVPPLENKAIEGHVRDAQGRGLAGVDVQAMGWRDYSRSSTKTDTSGHYRIEGIAGNVADTMWFRLDRYSDAELKSVAVGTTDTDVVMAPAG